MVGLGLRTGGRLEKPLSWALGLALVVGSHPASGLKAMNNLDGWTCTIFRNTGPALSSDLILAAEHELLSRHDCGPDGLLTYVWDKKVASVNPGYCFKVAGWRTRGRSADGRKTLLTKAVN